MAKVRSQFVCQNCGASFPRWSGRCDNCAQWNTLVEELAGSGIGAGPATSKTAATKAGHAIALVELSGEVEEAPRTPSSIAELDRVTGGGFVEGSAILLGGDPGIGKSTLLTQACIAMEKQGESVVYVSGEEAVSQIRLRAKRLGADASKVQLAAETNVENILTTLKTIKAPSLLIIDSIQTLWTSQVDSAPGTVTQVRASAQALIRYAKHHGTTVVLVGHVTKEGQIAGPRVVEHMVDAVLYFEGERGHQFRILRTVKNRFGPTDEIGVFSMTGKGLEEVKNPSELFLSDRQASSPGSAVFAGMEGTRPVLVEIQALVAPSSLGTPRRAVVGWDNARLSMVLAVLEAHCGVRLGSHDVYLSVAGGYRVQEPAADLAVAAALVSSLTGNPLPSGSAWFGEISLSGAVRQVSHSEQRLKEAAKLGFTQLGGPKRPNLKGNPSSAMAMVEYSDLAGLVADIVTSTDDLNQSQ